MHDIIQDDFKDKNNKNSNFPSLGGDADSNYSEHLARSGDQSESCAQWTQNLHDGLSRSGQRNSTDTDMFDRLMDGDNKLT